MHGGGLAARAARTGAVLLSAFVAIAVSVGGCGGSSGADKTKTARTLALAPAAAAVPGVSGAGASGGAGLAPDRASTAAKPSSKTASNPVHTQSTRGGATTTTTTVAAVPTASAPTTHSTSGSTPASRTVRKEKPPRRPPPPPASAGQSDQVVGCLTSAGLAHVYADRGILWTGWDKESGTFVYVQAYRTASDAATASNQLAPEEAAVAGRYVVHQPIARYAGSPVPVVVGCLTGHPVHKGKPPKKPGAFTF